jgi:hypothetical protein
MAYLMWLLVVTPLLPAGNTPSPSGVSGSCPVTRAAERRFAEPSPSSASRFWYGSEALAVLLKTGGTWRGMGPERRYRDKLFWWRQGFDGRTEPWPELVVTGRKLDGEAPPADVSRATNARHSDFGGWAMLTAVEFPARGCWELTGRYGGQKLSFVVRVGP